MSFELFLRQQICLFFRFITRPALTVEGAAINGRDLPCRPARGFAQRETFLVGHLLRMSESV